MIDTKIDDALPAESIERVFEIFSDGRRYVKLPWGVAYADVLPAVRRLIAKLEQVEKEADWLASRLAVKDCPLGRGSCKYRYTKKQINNPHDEKCRQCWCEEAKKWGK